MAEQQLEHEQIMRDIQRAYVDFLDDSDDQGIYDRLVRFVRQSFIWDIATVVDDEGLVGDCLGMTTRNWIPKIHIRFKNC